MAALRSFGKRYRAPLTRFLKGEDGDALIRHRPQPDVWSAVEYACHVRDTFLVQRTRVLRALVFDHPDLEPKGMWAWPELDHYNDSPVDSLLDGLGLAAEALARLGDGLSDEQWARPLIYNWPETADRTVSWLYAHTIHEGHHHLLDIGRVLRQARGR